MANQKLINKIKEEQKQALHRLSAAEHMLDDVDTYDYDREYNYYFDIIHSAMKYELACDLLEEKTEGWVIELYNKATQELIKSSPQLQSSIETTKKDLAICEELREQRKAHQKTAGQHTPIHNVNKSDDDLPF